MDNIVFITDVLIQILNFFLVSPEMNQLSLSLGHLYIK